MLNSFKLWRHHTPLLTSVKHWWTSQWNDSDKYQPKNYMISQFQNACLTGACFESISMIQISLLIISFILALHIMVVHKPRPCMSICSVKLYIIYNYSMLWISFWSRHSDLWPIILSLFTAFLLLFPLMEWHLPTVSNSAVPGTCDWCHSMILMENHGRNWNGFLFLVQCLLVVVVTIVND